jgi:hypothetical protein
VNNITPVFETSYSEYEDAKQAGRLFVEQGHGDYIYYAIKTARDVQFDNASAWFDMIERFKARKP